MSDPSNGHPRDLLSEYLDDELGIEARATVDRHLAGCEDCRGELDALRRLTRALAEESVPPVPFDLEARIALRLDGSTVVRPKRWRFAVPATIAATLGALGLFVALQWREGRIVVPPAPAPASAPAPTPERREQELDRARPPYAPAPPRASAAPRSDVLGEDLAAAPEEKQKKDSENAAVEAPGGVPGGVVGGMVGGIEGGAPGDSAAKEAMLMKAAAPRAAMSEVRSVCAESWSDSGVRAAWDVRDVPTAVGELNRMARDVSGIGVWRGTVKGGPYVLVVPRARFEEVFFALRARDLAGLVEPPALAPGSDCVGISIVLAVAASQPSPAPR